MTRTYLPSNDISIFQYIKYVLTIVKVEVCSKKCLGSLAAITHTWLARVLGLIPLDALNF